MHTTPLSGGSFYHVYNRGTEHRDVFLCDEDRRRFLRGCIVFNNDEVVHKKPELIRDGSHPLQARNPLVSIITYALMGNHIHLLLQQHCDDGIARFMHRLGTGYTKYFNRKYQRTGVLFESGYKSVLIEDDEQFLHVGRYIHLNPIDLLPISERNMLKLLAYPWSSLRHYVGEVSDPVVHGSLLTSMIGPEQYFDFVRDWIPQRRSKSDFDHDNSLYLE